MKKVIYNKMEVMLSDVTINDNSFVLTTQRAVSEKNRPQGIVIITDDDYEYAISTDDYSDISMVTENDATVIVFTYVNPMTGIEEQMAQVQEKTENAYRLYDFSYIANGKLYPITSNNIPESKSTGKFEILLPEHMQNEWAIESLAKWEVFDSEIRINAVPVFSFSMHEQRVLRVGLMTTGNAAKNFTHLQGALRLKHR